MLAFTIKASEIKTRIKEFSRESLPDVDCLAQSLDYTEALSRRDIEAARAHAWATADLEALEQLPALPNPGLTCVMAIMSSQVAKELLPGDIPEQVQARWIAEAERALRDNETTFAIVPLAKLMRADGYAARLRAKGYVVDAPADPGSGLGCWPAFVPGDVQGFAQQRVHWRIRYDSNAFVPDCRGEAVFMPYARRRRTCRRGRRAGPWSHRATPRSRASRHCAARSCPCRAVSDSGAGMSRSVIVGTTISTSAAACSRKCICRA